MIRRREVSSLFLIGEVETKLTCINKLGFYSAALGARMARAWSGVSWIYAVDETVEHVFPAFTAECFAIVVKKLLPWVLPPCESVYQRR